MQSKIKQTRGFAEGFLSVTQRVICGLPTLWPRGTLSLDISSEVRIAAEIPSQHKNHSLFKLKHSSLKMNILLLTGHATKCTSIRHFRGIICTRNNPKGDTSTVYMLKTTTERYIIHAYL